MAKKQSVITVNFPALKFLEAQRKKILPEEEEI